MGQSSNIVICARAVLPTFIILLLGFIARKAKIIRKEDIFRINSLIFKIFMPIMLFSNIYYSDISTALNGPLLLFTVFSILAMFGLSILIAKVTIRDKSKRSAVIHGMFRTNFVIVGLSIVTSLEGDSDLSAVAVMIGLASVCFNLLGVILLESYKDKTASKKHIVLDILKNPLLIGSVSGLLFLALGIKLPPSAEKAVLDLSKIASPLLLFVLGAFFSFDSVRKNMGCVVIATIGRLIVLPALLLPVAIWLGFRGLYFGAIIALLCSSSATNSFTLTQQMGGDAELAGDIVVVTTLFCILTMFAWCLLFKTQGIF